MLAANLALVKLPSSFLLPTFQPPILSITAMANEISACVWIELIKSNSSFTKDTQNCVRPFALVAFCSCVKLRFMRPSRSIFFVENQLLVHPFFCTERRQPAHLTTNHLCWKQVPKHGFWPRIGPILLPRQILRRNSPPSTLGGLPTSPQGMLSSPSHFLQALFEGSAILQSNMCFVCLFLRFFGNCHCCLLIRKLLEVPLPSIFHCLHAKQSQETMLLLGRSPLLYKHNLRNFRLHTVETD